MKVVFKSENFYQKIYGYCIAFVCFMTSTNVYALDLETGLKNVLNHMTGPIAMSAGAIALAGVGYVWFRGRLDFHRLIACLAGILLIFGGAELINIVKGGA